mmetsp:Transcript_24142/g.47322  ORF Transcript_24142/g.47322 Transcript_24142/m.47322 type:complete len:85 (+) Transcript_24142:457-711(+)
MVSQRSTGLAIEIKTGVTLVSAAPEMSYARACKSEDGDRIFFSPLDPSKAFLPGGLSRVQFLRTLLDSSFITCEFTGQFVTRMC